MGHTIEIKNNTFIIPNISGYSKVANHGLSGKPGFFIFHSGNPSLVEFTNEEEANEKRNELIEAINNFWRAIINFWQSNHNFNSTHKENKNNFNSNNKGFFNKKHGR